MNLTEYQNALRVGELKPRTGDTKTDVSRLQEWNARLRAEEKFDSEGRPIESTSLSPDADLATIPRGIFRCTDGHESVIRTRRNLAKCVRKNCHLQSKRIEVCDDV